MQAKRFVYWTLIFGLILNLSDSVVAVDCTCTTCDDCESQLSNATCTAVYLTANISGVSGDCISNPAGFENKVFDCQGNTIDGNDIDDGGTDSGIYLMDKSGNIIRNCVITDFLWGIYILGSLRDNITNSTISSNYRGIVIQSSNNLTVESNNIVNNTWDGINIWDTSRYNTLNDNTIDNNAGDGGMVLNSQFASAEPRDNVISDNTITNNNDGIIFWATCSLTECDSAGENNSFVNNNISNNAGVAINMSCIDDGGTYCAPNASSSNVNFNNNFTNNTINDNRDGIALTYANGTDIYSNTICSNTAVDIDNSSSDPFAAGDGNTCNNTQNWNDAGTTGCTTACGATPATACGDTITSDTTLISNLTCSNTAITIGASDITLDGAGYSLIFNGSDNYGISGVSASRNNLTIKNLNAFGFMTGINLRFVNNSLVDNNTLQLNDIGIDMWNADNNIISNNSVITNTLTGIRVYGAANNIISQNTLISNNITGIRATASSDNNTITNNTVNGTTNTGIYFETSSNTTFEWNTVCNNTLDINDSSSTTGDYNTCDTTTNYNDTGATGCATACGAATIVSCGDNITSDTTLTSNLNCNNTALFIGADNITLNCDNYTINGSNSEQGIDLTNYTNVTIRNCTIMNFSKGIRLQYAENNTIESNTVSNCNIGIFLDSFANYNTLSSNTALNNDDGINLQSSSYNNITGNTASNNSQSGIYGTLVSENNTISGNTANYNTESGIEMVDDYNNITSNTANYNADGIRLVGDNTFVSGNTANNNNNGFSLSGSHNNTFLDNTASNNNVSMSFYDSNNNTLAGNTGDYSQSHGFHIQDAQSTGNVLNNNRFCNSNQSGGSWFDIYDADSNSGGNNSCITAYNYNDTGATGCTYLCSVARSNATINCSVNETVGVNSSSVNVSLELMTNTSINNTNITLRRYNTSTRSASLSVPSLGKYISIDADEQLSNSLEFVLLKIFFTEEELTSSGLNETDLGMWWYNSSLGAWQMLNADAMNWVYGTGTNTTDDYVWGNLSHFSDYTIAQGTETQSIPLLIGWNLISIPLEI